MFGHQAAGHARSKAAFAYEFSSCPVFMELATKNIGSKGTWAGVAAFVRFLLALWALH
jgi:hypothetical protein